MKALYSLSVMAVFIFTGGLAAFHLIHAYWLAKAGDEYISTLEQSTEGSVSLEKQNGRDSRQRQTSKADSHAELLVKVSELIPSHVLPAKPGGMWVPIEVQEFLSSKNNTQRIDLLRKSVNAYVAGGLVMTVIFMVFLACLAITAA